MAMLLQLVDRSKSLVGKEKFVAAERSVASG